MSVRPAHARTPSKRTVRTDLRVVRRRGRTLIRRTSSTRFAWITIVGAIAAIGLVMFVLLEQVILAESAFELKKVRERIEKLQDRQEELLLQAARLESPARIERYAKTNLGMVDAQNVEYIVADIGLRSESRLALTPRPTKLPPAGQAAAAPSAIEEAGP